jgi:hypothetical protein
MCLVTSSEYNVLIQLPTIALSSNFSIKAGISRIVFQTGTDFPIHNINFFFLNINIHVFINQINHFNLPSGAKTHPEGEIIGSVHNQEVSFSGRAS